MEMGKLTAKLRDAVPVCLLVAGKEIKRYKNIEIPDALKVLEYKHFKFDVPLSGAITFKIMFEPGVLPEEFPQTRERKTRKPLAQEAQPQEAAVAAEAELQQEPQPQDEQATEALPTSAAEAFAQALEDAQTAGEPVADIAAAMVDGEAIKAEIVEIEGEGRLVVITVEPEATEAMPEATKATAEAEAQPEDSEPTKKPVRKGKGKKGAASTEDADM
jgi:hypothetical protein